MTAHDTWLDPPDYPDEEAELHEGLSDPEEPDDEPETDEAAVDRAENSFYRSSY